MDNKNISIPIEITETGEVVDIKSDVVTIKGMPGCVYGEIVEFSSGDSGLIIEFDSEKVRALLIGHGGNLKTGDKAISRGNPSPSG